MSGPPPDESPHPGDRLCRIDHLLGHEHACAGERCPYWEPGLGLVQGACIFRGVDLAGRHDLAGWLATLRERLASADPAGSAVALRRLSGRSSPSGEA